MPKTWNRTETWLALMVVGIGGLLAALAGLHTYMVVTATPLHPEPDRVPSTSQADPSPAWAVAVERARDVVRAGLSQQNLPGLSVAVGIGDELAWAEGFGWADLDARVPVTPALRFRLGTASTALTAAAVGLLVEQGRMSLDAEIQEYVPEFPKKPWPVTVRQLMGHQAGVRNDGGDEGPLLSASCDRPVDALTAFADRPLLFEPDTQARYSSYGWILISAAVEAAAGQPFLRVMRDQVFEPLAMRDTLADSAAVPVPNLPTFYFPRYAAEPRYGLHLMRPLDYSCYAGASVFLSTPSDLVRFGMAMRDSRLLRPSTVALLHTPQRLRSGEETGYGLGWDVGTATLAAGPTRRVGRAGTLLGGTVSSLVLVPESGIVVAVLSNIAYADTEHIALQLAEAFAAGAAPSS